MTYERSGEQLPLSELFENEVQRLLETESSNLEGYTEQAFSVEPVEARDLSLAVGAAVEVDKAVVSTTDYMDSEGVFPPDYQLELSGWFNEARLITEFNCTGGELTVGLRVVVRRADGTIDRGSLYETAKQLGSEADPSRRSEIIRVLMNTIQYREEAKLRLEDDPERFKAALRVLKQLPKQSA